MAELNQSIKHGWVWLFAIIIFFFNTLSIFPQGLTLVLLLSPLWLYLLYSWNKLQIAIVLLLPLLIFIPIHLSQGVSSIHYFKSMSMLCLLLMFASAFYIVINQYPVNLDLIFKDITVLNFFFVILSIGLFFIPSLKELVWYMLPLTEKLKLRIIVLCWHPWLFIFMRGQCSSIARIFS
jgi:hypothetical protein